MSDGEVFDLGPHQWDIDAARTLTADNPVEYLPTRALGALLGLIYVDANHLNDVDLTEPILLARLPGLPDGDIHALVPIDGWHRIARAVRDGVPELPTRQLTPEQDDQVRRYRPRRQLTRRPR